MRFALCAALLILACTAPVSAAETDTDADGLSDRLEAAFQSDPALKDSDGDGYLDGHEVANGYDPARITTVPLKKEIHVSIKDQRLRYSLKGVALGEMKISSGMRGFDTPTGTFQIYGKQPRAWSRSSKLWMPWWMSFTSNGKYGLHELPEWPNGRKEGVKSLGHRASHGCIRLGISDAKKLYEWAPVGISVVIQ